MFAIICVSCCACIHANLLAKLCDVLILVENLLEVYNLPNQLDLSEIAFCSS
jgi:hypothetical protein